MDVLDFLKQDWKKEKNFPHLSYDEIYKLLWKKSSSVVKWIFVISILELLLSTLLNIILVDDAYWQNLEKIGLKNFYIVLSILGYLITFYFIYRFYKNYRKISNTDDAATLMSNIIKTRKTVKTYIAFVLISAGISGLVTTFFTAKKINASELPGSDNIEWIPYVLITFIALSIFLGLLWLFYKLIYGIFLKRLKRNYKELKKLEV